MAAPGHVLVVGGGAAGTATAILLARAGVTVDLVEAGTEIGRSGSGITLQGNALRVFRDLGVLDDVLAAGYAFDVLGLRTPDGTVIAEFPDAKTGGDDLPATVGMPRGEMARLLAERAAAVGAKVRTATRLESVTPDGHVTLSDGTTQAYDLVVGADGVNSGVRVQLGIDTRPEPLGMGIWRVFTSRPASITRTDLTYGGAAYIAGYCPTGDDSIYAYLVEDATDRTGLAPDEQLATMRELAGHYGGPWTEIRDRMTDASRVNYTWFTHHLVDGPWHRGRVVLAGDAAHSCPPTLAQGAAMALEDATVLVEELLAHDDLEAALAAYTTRRRERAGTVVANSVQLAHWLLAHEPPPQAGGTADVPGLMARTSALLAQRP
ncbi:FAD-dependent oxidoreductase [Actinomycetospora corticicola]|uniref:2-polyprenyl-6-methoxyphenol hydroxylase-like FAD-dependent oxidoreductase n=1 Tax=Actinomycetospora corticicola TaxID=663602 RepID=A0A7Y9DVN4_9PSEU|nr:FAD-dependent monooxygenase [Actinomycetospora corticicola]NYD36373.1 2-polyprenyl-6-methoxyphenol hydroxylase-like FAD-dependent oxidoreductase [Actinomycetospora corticicola]